MVAQQDAARKAAAEAAAKIRQESQRRIANFQADLDRECIHPRMAHPTFAGWVLCAVSEPIEMGIIVWLFPVRFGMPLMSLTNLTLVMRRGFRRR
jgi:hypothetical protein